MTPGAQGVDSPLWTENTLGRWRDDVRDLHTIKHDKAQMLDVCGVMTPIWFTSELHSLGVFKGRWLYFTREDARRNHDQILIDMGLLARRVSA